MYIYIYSFNYKGCVYDTYGYLFIICMYMMYICRHTYIIYYMYILYIYAYVHIVFVYWIAGI